MTELPIYPEKITLDEKIEVLKREIDMRKQVYPSRCIGPNAKMKPEKASFQIAAMEAILKDYEALKAKEGVQTSLF